MTLGKSSVPTFIAVVSYNSAAQLSMKKEGGTFVQQGDFSGFIALVREETRHPARLIGMSLFWAWLQAVFSLPGTATAILNNLPIEPHHQIWTLSLLVTVVGFAFALISKTNWMTVRPSGILAVHVIMVTGTACLALSGLVANFRPLVFVGALGTGLGSAGAFLQWGMYLSHLEPRRVLLDTAAFALLTAITYGLCSLLPEVIEICAVALMPLASGTLLAAAMHQAQLKDPVGSQEHGTSEFDRQNRVENALSHRSGNLIGLAVLVGAVYGLIRGASLSFGGTTIAGSTAATVTGIAVAGLLLAATTVFFRKESEFYLACEVSFPLLAAGYLLLPSITNSTFPLPLLVFTVGHTYFYFMLWVFCVDQSHMQERKTIPVFAGGLLAFLGSSLIGSITSDVLALTGYEGGSLLGALSLIVAYTFILVLVFVLGRTRTRGNRALREADLQKKSDFRKNALDVAQENALTPRETEVFVLIAEGYDRPAIRDKLVISNDTVKTHVRHIYAKLDIHSKQEAQQLVQKRCEQDERGM